MHFDIDATGTVLPVQARAYLEYRLFSVLSRFGDDVFAVRVRLREGDHSGRKPLISCWIQVRLRPCGDAVSEASAEWLYGAIDRGADAAGAAVGQVVARSV
jgi:hypothetical protein